MLGDTQSCALFESEFADEYQAWVEGQCGALRAAWFDEPVRKMARESPLCVHASDTVREVVQKMRERHCGRALIVGTTSITGIFSERDLLRRVVAEGRDANRTVVSDVMTGKPEVLPITATVAQALRHMARARYRHLPLVDDAGQPLAMISARQIMRFVSETFPKEVLNCPPEGTHEALQQEGA